jgi:hypothetical protein
VAYRRSMDYDPGWPVCAHCGRRVGRYELAWIEHTGGRLSSASVLGLDARARRDTARVWHEPCFTAAGEGQPAAADATVPPRSEQRRRAASG